MSYSEISEMPARDWHNLKWLIANYVIGWDVDARVTYYLAMIADILIRANSKSRHPVQTFGDLHPGLAEIELRSPKEKSDPTMTVGDYLGNLKRSLVRDE